MKTIRLIFYILILGIASLPGRAYNPPADCDADFEFSYVPTTPIHVQFTDISTGDPTSWFWDFGDGNTSTEQNPVHPYPKPGLYEVCLIIEHDVPPNYCSDTICKMVEIPDTVACEAIYSYSIDPLFPLEVTFFDHSVGNITNWEWNFGDGTTSLEQNPIHIFPDPGEFLVCLNVYNADSMESCFHFICEIIDIPDTMTCIAEFAIVADSSSMVMNHFSFYDQSNGYPDNWFWEFGDGSFSTEQHPTHEYTEPGLYEVCLNSWNSSFLNCNDTRCKLVQTPNYYKLGGQAFIGETPINNPYHTGDTGMAILYRQRSDMGLVAVDTNIFFEHGYFWFSDMMELPYVIKIGLTEGSANFDAVVPSYYPSMMFWQDAASVMLDEDNFESHTSLLETIELETGPGGIKGRIIDDKRWELIHTRGFSDVPVILTDMLSQPLGWTQTNANGQFTFNNMAYGSYLVYADLTGMYSLPETVILSEDYPLADSVFIEMSLTPLLSIREPEQRMFDILALYPNPAKSSIKLNISAGENTGIEIIVYNQLGQQMLGENHMIYKGENKLEINISQLPESIYFLRMQAIKGTPLMKTFIKVD